MALGAVVMERVQGMPDGGQANPKGKGPSMTGHKHFWKGVLTALVVLGGGVALSAGAADAAGLPEWDGAKLVSSDMCTVCHGKEDVGNQTAVLAQGPHAKAVETLKSDKAKEVAAKVGVADPATSGKCLKCHSTAYGFTEEAVTEELEAAEGVTCQTCHGPGEDYNPKERHDTDAKVQKAVEKYGLIVPNEKNTCVRCHNEASPTYDTNRYTRADGTKTAFDYEQALKKIEHKVKKAQ